MRLIYIASELKSERPETRNPAGGLQKTNKTAKPNDETSISGSEMKKFWGN